MVNLRAWRLNFCSSYMNMLGNSPCICDVPFKSPRCTGPTWSIILYLLKEESLYAIQCMKVLFAYGCVYEEHLLKLINNTEQEDISCSR